MARLRAEVICESAMLLGGLQRLSTVGGEREVTRGAKQKELEIGSEATSVDARVQRAVTTVNSFLDLEPLASRKTPFHRLTSTPNERGRPRTKLRARCPSLTVSDSHFGAVEHNRG
jgi:hypothetical protein